MELGRWIGRMCVLALFAVGRAGESGLRLRSSKRLSVYLEPWYFDHFLDTFFRYDITVIDAEPTYHDLQQLNLIL